MDYEYMKGLSDHIRVNLPATPEDEGTGNGEGCWALVTSEAKAAYDSNETGGEYFGILDNDSIFYPSIDHGAIILLSLRGPDRAIANYAYLCALQAVKSTDGLDELHAMAQAAGVSWAELWEAYKNDGIMTPDTVIGVLRAEELRKVEA